MENYFTFTQLLGLRDSEGANLPLFKEARLRRYQSVEKMMDLMEIAQSTHPKMPTIVTTLNPFDRTLALTQPSGTTRCPSPLSTAPSTGCTAEALLRCW